MKRPKPFGMRGWPTDEGTTEIAFFYYDRWVDRRWCVDTEGVTGLTMEEAEEFSKWLAECVAYSREERK